jgi:hypothetical protein
VTLHDNGVVILEAVIFMAGIPLMAYSRTVTAGFASITSYPYQQLGIAVSLFGFSGIYWSRDREL